MRKKFKDLDLSDAFMFAAALEDEGTCQLVLEVILGKSIPKVKVHSEHTILYNSNFRSVRLDVYAEDEVRVFYDLEMQNADEKNFFNTKGTRAVNVSQELIHFLNYVENGEKAAEEGFGETPVGKIHERVRRLKRSRELEGSYMRFEELLMDSKAEGKKEDIIELLQEVGEVSEDLQSRIKRQWKLETLSLWLKLAAKAESIEEFESKIQ